MNKMNTFEDFKERLKKEEAYYAARPIRSAIKNAYEFFLYGIPRHWTDGRYEIKWAWQRVFKGYDDPSVWSHHSVMSEVTAKMLRELAENKVGCPMDLYDSKNKKDECHKWRSILIKMAEGFEAATAIDNMDWFTDDENGSYDKRESDKKRKALEKKFDTGMKLYHEYYFNLWD